jgi:two-component system osmolarity sensor histidine kinase EnvZ
VSARTSLFQKVWRAVSLALLLALAASAWLGYQYVLRPLATRSADDFAALLLLSASSYMELGDDARGHYIDNLCRQHQLEFRVVATPLPGDVRHHPYLNLLRSALERRLQGPQRVRVGEYPDGNFHAELEFAGQWLRFSFDKQRITPRPQRAVVGGILALLLASLASAYVLARHLSRPVVALAERARQIGRGESPTRWPQSPIREISELSDAFSAMSDQLKTHREQQLTLMAGISHDLRSPLARLRMAVGMLDRDDDDPVRRRMELDIDEMVRLVAAQLDLTRAQQPEAARPIDACALLQEVADAAEARLPGSVSLQLHANACQAQLPEMALHRLLANLVDNAQLHAGGKLSIVCRKLQRTLCIGVRDRGPGIPREQEEAIFRPFHRLDPARQRSTGGSGLGLAIARQLAQTHGWTLGVRPRRGGGSSFWLLIPLPATAAD